MDVMEVVALIVAIGLFCLLGWAMLRPERF
jgi:K+-transporting ATPase KdpF subunit